MNEGTLTIHGDIERPRALRPGGTAPAGDGVGRGGIIEFERVLLGLNELVRERDLEVWLDRLRHRGRALLRVVVVVCESLGEGESRKRTSRKYSLEKRNRKRRGRRRTTLLSSSNTRNRTLLDRMLLEGAFEDIGESWRLGAGRPASTASCDPWAASSCWREGRAGRSAAGELDGTSGYKEQRGLPSVVDFVLHCLPSVCSLSRIPSPQTAQSYLTLKATLSAIAGFEEQD